MSFWANWISTDSFEVTGRCLVPFRLGPHKRDAHCDVLLVDVSYVLLEQLLQVDDTKMR